MIEFLLSESYRQLMANIALTFLTINLIVLFAVVVIILAVLLWAWWRSFNV